MKSTMSHESPQSIAKLNTRFPDDLYVIFAAQINAKTSTKILVVMS